MTTYKKKKLKDREGNYIVTPSSADMVYCQDGSTLEQKLNNIENDEFSPTITQVESMAKVGVGTDVDVSANVQDGYAKSAILKGNTKVNLIQESSSQDVVLPYEFAEGQSVTINDTKESGALGVELKGQTLVNLGYHGGVQHPTYQSIVDGWSKIEVQSGNEQSYNAWYVKTQNMLKPNTTYALLTWVKENTLSSVWSAHLLNTNESPFISGTKAWQPKETGFYFEKITTGNSTDDKVVALRTATGAGNSAGQYIMYRLVLLEYQEGMENWDIPYFEGMQSVQAPSVTTVGKNLFDAKQVSSSSNFGVTLSKNGDTLRLSGTPSRSYGSHNINVKLKKGKTYSFQIFINGVAHRGTGYKMWGHNSDSLIVNIFSGDKFTPLKDVLSTYLVWEGLTVGKEITIDNIEIQIEESSTATTYEPYKSTTLTLPEEITLRGIGNVKDTLNTVTGEYTQRIGEVVLDGSEDETIGKASDYGFADYVNSEYSAFRVSSSSMTNKHHELNDQKNIIKTDKFNVITSWLIHQGTPQEGITNYHDTAITISILKSKLTENTVAGFKQYLQQNPITVQYRLATPITKKLDLTFTNQDNQPATKLSTYNTTTHINASSKEGSLIPTLSHVNPSYPVILKPSTKYSIVADSYSNDHTNSPINFNLGGATVSTTVSNRVSTVTTPSTLTSEKLTMSGRGNMLNNVMVIEGDVVGDEPYFEGMCDVEMPVVTNVGKNLFDKSDVTLGSYLAESLGKETLVDSTETFYQNSYVKLRKNTNYIINPQTKPIRLHFYNDKKEYQTRITNITTNQTTFNSQDYSFARLSCGIADLDNIQLEESPTPTTYEPYKSNILSCNSEVVLRSLPNGVCDTLDLMTGEYVQRIGEIVLDGSNEGGSVENLSEYTRFRMPFEAAKNNYLLSPNITVRNKLFNSHGAYEYIMHTDTAFYIHVLTSRLEAQTVTAFKSYLQSNPITVQYELATPITTTIDLVPSGTNPTTKPFVWKDGHVQLLSEQGTLTPSLEYSVITSRGGQILDNTRQIAKQDKRIYDLEMLLISSSIEDAYQRLALQNSVQMLNYNEELKVNPIRYYMLSRLIEEEMYQESDMLDKLDAFFLYGEINTEQYYGLSKAIVGDNAIATLDEVIASHEIQVDIPTTLEELPVDKPSTLEEMPIDKPTTLEEEVLPSDRPTTLEEQPIIEEVEDAPVVELKDCSKTYTLLMNKLELSIQRVEDLAHYVDLANAYICANRLSYEEYELVIARIENAYISLH